MIRRDIAERHCDPYYAIHEVLENDREHCLTKEEIFVRLPRDDEGIPLVSFSAMTNALRNLVRVGEINVFYVRGTSYYGVSNKR